MFKNILFVLTCFCAMAEFDAKQVHEVAVGKLHDIEWSKSSQNPQFKEKLLELIKIVKEDISSQALKIIIHTLDLSGNTIDAVVLTDLLTLIKDQQIIGLKTLNLSNIKMNAANKILLFQALTNNLKIDMVILSKDIFTADEVKAIEAVKDLYVVWQK